MNMRTRMYAGTMGKVLLCLQKNVLKFAYVKNLLYLCSR